MEVLTSTKDLQLHLLLIVEQCMVFPSDVSVYFYVDNKHLASDAVLIVSNQKENLGGVDNKNH